MPEDFSAAKRRPDGSIDIAHYLDEAARQRSIAWRGFPWLAPLRRASKAIGALLLARSVR